MVTGVGPKHYSRGVPVPLNLLFGGSRSLSSKLARVDWDVFRRCPTRCLSICKEKLMISPTYKVNVSGSKTGSIFLSARPRGGDWLRDEVISWKAQGIQTLVSFLTKPEEEDLDLLDEKDEARAIGISFISIPIEDREVPRDLEQFSSALDEIDAELHAGKHVLLHCRQGIGRTGLVAASLLILSGMNSDDALDLLAATRGITVPETAEQKRWIISLSKG
jgi:protein-tyrosine phosphatase